MSRGVGMELELVKNVLYRYEDYLEAAGVDEWDIPVGRPRVRVVLHQFPVIRWTPKGAWISLGAGERKFVLLTARKRYALRTRREALLSFIKRKKRQCVILRARLRNAEDALRIADVLEKERM